MLSSLIYGITDIVITDVIGLSPTVGDENPTLDGMIPDHQCLNADTPPGHH
jgi:hypothetical protein